MPLIVRLGKISFDSRGLFCANVADDYAPYNQDSRMKVGGSSNIGADGRS